MMKCTLFALSLSAMLSAVSLVNIAPAAAQDDAMMKPMDCSKAAEMLSSAEKMGFGGGYTGVGEIDRIILPSVIDREKGTNMMLHIEAECGKDPKMKAMAAKAAADSDAKLKMMEAAMPADMKK